MSELKIKVLNSPIFEGVAQDLVLKTDNTNRIVVANTGPISLQSNVNLSNNLNFTGAGNRITGDFNRTVSTRVMFQTSTANQRTFVGILPSGSSVTSGLNIFNSSDPANSSQLFLNVNNTAAAITSTISGTGTVLPMTFNIGSEAMRIDTDRNVGIGTSSPITNLHVASRSAGDSPTITVSNDGTTTGFATLKLQRGATAATDFANVYHQAGGGSATLIFLAAHPTTPGIRFLTGDGTTNTTRMTIDAFGGVGIGIAPTTQNGGNMLQIGAVTNIVGTSDSTFLSNNVIFNSGYKYITSNEATMYYQSAGQHEWYNAAAGTSGNAVSLVNVMTLNASGWLGLSDSTPISRLHLNTDGNTYVGGITLQNGSNQAHHWYLSTNTTSRFEVGSSAGAWEWVNGNGNRMVLDSAGDLGLGTTIPYRKLEVVGDGITVGSTAGSSALGIDILAPQSSIPAAQVRSYIAPGTSDLGNFSNGDLLIASRTSAATNIRFITGTTPATNMILTAAGLVGIGTTTPDANYRLHVAGNLLATGSLRIEGSQIRCVGGGSAATPSIQPGDDADTGMYWGGSNVIGFSTAGVLRASIGATGQLNTYADLNTYSIVAQNSNATPFGIRSHYPSAAPNGTGNVFYIATDNVGTKFTVRSNGGIANFSANDANLSDRREKKDFEPSGNYLEKLCQIPVQKFRYINQAEDDDGLSLGVVAQDVQEICPEFVMESDWSNGEEGSEPKMRLSIYQTDLQYAMMRAIQELKAEFDAYKESHP